MKINMKHACSLELLVSVWMNSKETPILPQRYLLKWLPQVLDNLQWLPTSFELCIFEFSSPLWSSASKDVHDQKLSFLTLNRELNKFPTYGVVYGHIDSFIGFVVLNFELLEFHNGICACMSACMEFWKFHTAMPICMHKSTFFNFFKWETILVMYTGIW